MWYPGRKWLRKVKRRRPGIYLVRTDRHANRARRENGYVGRSNNWRLRRRCHLGQCAHRGCVVKPWADLRPVWHVLRLPWWLGWVWVLAPLEAAAILALAPRYNHALNLANPRRVSLSRQAAQRAARDAGGLGYRVHARMAHLGRRALQGVGVALILAGPIGWAVTR